MLSIQHPPTQLARSGLSDEPGVQNGPETVQRQCPQPKKQILNNAHCEPRGEKPGPRARACAVPAGRDAPAALCRESVPRSLARFNQDEPYEEIVVGNGKRQSCEFSDDRLRFFNVVPSFSSGTRGEPNTLLSLHRNRNHHRLVGGGR